jgi:hypothetical protein
VASKPTKKVGDYRENFYAGTCAVCGATVPAHAGFVFKEFGGKGPWLVQHVQGQCPVTPAEAAELAEIKTMQPRLSARHAGGEDPADGGPDPHPWASADVRARDKVSFSKIPQGYYATKSRTGSNDLDFWFVRVPENGQWAGFRFVKRYLGGQGPIRISKGEQTAALRAILEDGTDAAAHLFAQELGRCYRCGRDLTDDASRAAGIGPVCAGK